MTIESVIENNVTEFVEKRIESNIQDPTVIAVNSVKYEGAVVLGSVEHISNITMTVEVFSYPDEYQSIYNEDYKFLAEDIASNVYDDMIANGYSADTSKEVYIQSVSDSFVSRRQEFETNVQVNVFAANEVQINDTVIDPCGLAKYFTEEEMELLRTKYETTEADEFVQGQIMKKLEVLNKILRSHRMFRT